VRIAALYAVESDIRGLSADERRQARQRHTKPLIDALRSWLEAKLAAVSGKSTIAEAIRYALSRWDGLIRFLDDGRIEIDSNVVERAIRPIAMIDSFYTSSSSVCKHWDLPFGIDLTRATFLLECSNDLLTCEVGRTDLVWCVGHDLLADQDAGFDELANLMMADTELGGGIAQRQPLAILLGRAVAVDAAYAADRADAVRCPGLALAGRHSHSVQ
jgi:hypothetical protein